MAAHTQTNDPPNPGANPVEPASLPPRDVPAWRSTRAWVVMLSVLAVGLIVDLVSKDLAFARIADQPVRIDRADVLALPSPSMVGSLLPPHTPMVVVPRVLEFRLVLNPGAVFGIGAGKRWFFVVFSTCAMAVGLWMFGTWTHARDAMAHVGVGLVAAGGLGNLYDRLTFACVRDFLHPLPGVHLPFGLAWPGGERQIWPWVSNVADAILIVGVGLLLIHLWRVERKQVTKLTGTTSSQ